ncbi:unnamed protein product [Calicophoron daubneyi]|uniref:Vacuolar protein sorting-associated protein 16 homolog n=1 Tax=Calicophoron daubneyi TaxID=300641 RepID=A0AAV2TN33_CALDB
MKSLGEDWYAVGDIYFRTLHLFDMPWGSGFSFAPFKLALCQCSGHIAMLLDSQSGSKPVLQIFTASGKLVSQQLWKDAPPLTVGWSTHEDLLVVQKSGFTSILDLRGNFVRRFSMGTEAEEREVIEAKFFTFHNRTGVAILTGGKHIFLTTDVETPHMRRMAEISGPNQAISIWELVTSPLNSVGVKSGTSTETFRGPWVIMTRKKSVFRADFSASESVDLPALAKLSFSEIRLVSVSQSMKFVALYLDNGVLLVTNLRMTEVHSQVDLTERISVMLPTSEDVGQLSISEASHPLAMLWSTNSAVVLQWNHLLALVGAHGDVYESFYPEDVYLTEEVDGVRVLTPTSSELIQRVPPALEALGRIGASCPATWLLSANSSLKAGSGRANDYLMPIQQSKQMIEAISHCTEAASHAVFDLESQQNLLEAAHMGRIFLSAMFTDPKDMPDAGTVKELAERAFKVCRTLRLLNSMAVPWIGIALTWRQFKVMTAKQVLERLLARNHYPMALEFVLFGPDEYQSTDSSGMAKQPDRNVSGLTRILSHWACKSKSAGSENSATIAEHLSAIVRKIYAKITCEPPELHTSHDGTVSNLKPSVLGALVKVNFAEIASQALVVGREKVAEQLLEYEPRAWHQVPLLLKLGRYGPALVRAVETGDPELITVVVAALQDQAKLPPADLAMVLRRHPIAMAIYRETWGQLGSDTSTTDSSASSNATRSVILSFSHEDDRATEAKKAVLSAYKETNLSLRLTALQNAEEIYKQLKNEFMTQECNAAIRLLRFQSKLEKQEVRAPVFILSAAPSTTDTSPDSPPLILPVVKPGGVEEKLWVGEPLNTTLARLLAAPQCERFAEQLRREFRVSEKRFAHLRLIGLALQNDCWTEVAKMMKAKKPPVSIETLIKICIDGNHFEETHKLIPRLPPERRVKFWMLCGQVEEAIQTAVREKSEDDIIYIQEQIGRGNQTMYDRLTALRQQLR